LAVLLPPSGSADQAGAGAARPAAPVNAITGILDAFRRHDIVGLGDAHGDQQGEQFQLALIRDPRFPAVAHDIVIETGNSKYQDVVDRFVRGEAVDPDVLRRPWLDTTQQQVASLQPPAMVMAVRDVNRALSPDRQLRVLLGEPPIDWEALRTPKEYEEWAAEPRFDRDAFAVELLKSQVLAKKRRALLTYGSAHFFRKVVHQSIVTLLEGSGVHPFTIWTNAAADLAKMQPDVATWPVPSLANLRGTVLGKVGLSAYLGPNAGDVPEQWLAPIEDQFDAVLYVGPLSAITLGRPQPWPCSEPALAERARRASVQRPGMGDRILKDCAR
jgi:hypothetical protein